MYLKCKCGKLLDLDKLAVDNMFAEKKNGKAVILCNPSGFTVIEHGGCKYYYALSIAPVTMKPHKLKKAVEIDGKPVKVMLWPEAKKKGGKK